MGVAHSDGVTVSPNVPVCLLFCIIIENKPPYKYKALFFHAFLSKLRE